SPIRDVAPRPSPPASNHAPFRDATPRPSPPASNDTPSVTRHIRPRLLHPTTPPPVTRHIRQPPRMSDIRDVSPPLMLPAPNGAPVHDATPSIPPCPHLQQT
ncbi:hypothetical protein BDN70DRAFT_821771, partial [Pholiota conissans]